MTAVKKCTKCGETKPLNGFYDRGNRASGKYSSCKACVDAVSKAWAVTNRARVRELANLERVRNREKHLAREAIHRAANPERRSREAIEWARRNPDKVRANKSKRRATKLRAAPAWGNAFFISEIYDIARRRRIITGLDWHVDHIVPLVSKTVCGLHVEHNLRVVLARINRNKSNRIWPHMPDSP